MNCITLLTETAEQSKLAYTPAHELYHITYRDYWAKQAVLLYSSHELYHITYRDCWAKQAVLYTWYKVKASTTVT